MDNNIIDTLYIDIRLRSASYDAGLRDLQRQLRAVSGALGTQMSNDINNGFSRALSGSGGIQSTLSNAVRNASRSVNTTAQQAGQTAGRTFSNTFSGAATLNQSHAAAMFSGFNNGIVRTSAVAGTNAGQALTGAFTLAMSNRTGNRLIAQQYMGNMQSDLLAAAGQIGSRLGPEFASIGSKLGGALAAAFAVAVAGMFVGVAKEFKNLAYEADAANISMDVFQRTVQKAGIPVDKANESINNMSASLKVSKLALMENAAGLLRTGYSMEQVEAIYTVAAASAVRAGKTTAYGIEQVNQALLTGNSRFLNTIGIRLNLVDAEKMYAQQLGKTKSQLTDSERLQANVNLLYKDSGQEVEFLARSLSGLSGATSDQQIAMEQLRQTIGQAFIPVTNEVVRSITAMVNRFQDWAANTSEGQQFMATLSKKLSEFGQAVVEAAGNVQRFFQSAGFADFARRAQTAFEAVKTIVGDFIDVFKEQWPETSKQVGRLIDAIDKLGGVVGPILDGIRRSILTVAPMFTGLANAVVSTVSAITKALGGLSDSVSKVMTGDIPGALETANTAISDLKKDLAEWPLDAVTKGVKGTVDNITTLWATGGQAWGTAASENFTKVVDQQIANAEKKIADAKQRMAQEQGQQAISDINQLKGPLANPLITNPGSQPKLITDSLVKSQASTLNDKILSTAIEGLAGPGFEKASGWCSKWVREVLKKAVGSESQKLFGSTALSTERNFAQAGYSMKATIGNMQQLKPGDLVFYAGDKSGAGHVGVYAGNGQVAGNNQIDGKDGRDARGLRGLYELGTPTSIARYGGFNAAYKDKFIDTVAAREEQKRTTTAAKPDPSFAELVKRLVAINKELENAGNAIKADPYNQANIARYQKANNALDAEKDKSGTYKDQNLYKAAQMATEKILENEHASYAVNADKVTKLLPQAVSLLKRQAELEGDTGQVATKNLKEYYDVKAKIGKLGENGDGKAALDLAQKRIEAEKQGVSLTNAMTTKALELARALKAAKDNGVLNPKALYDAQAAFDKFASSGKSQQFAANWAMDAIGKEKGAPFEQQLTQAEKLVQSLYKAQSMAFGPARTKAIDESTQAIKRFADGNANAALAIQFAQEKYGKLQTIADKATARTRELSIPKQSDSQLQTKLKAEQAKGAGADLNFIDALQKEIDKRTAALEKKRADYATAFSDYVNRLSTVGNNGELASKSSQLISRLLGVDPRQALEDVAYINDIKKALDSVAKQPGGEYFAGLQEQLTGALEIANQTADTLKAADDALATVAQDAQSALFSDMTDQVSSMVDELRSQLNQTLWTDPLSSMDGFTQTLNDIQGAVDSMRDMPDLYDQTQVGKLQDALDSISQDISNAVDNSESMAQYAEEGAYQYEEYSKILDRIAAIKDKINSAPLEVDASQIDQLAADLQSLDQTDYVKMTLDTLSGLKDGLSTAQDIANATLDESEATAAWLEESSAQADELSAILARVRDIKSQAEQDPLSVRLDDIEQIKADLKSLEQTDYVKYQVQQFDDWSAAITKVRSGYAGLAETNAKAAGTNSSGTGVIRAEVQNLRKQVTDLLADLTQFPGMTIVNDKQFDGLKARLQRITDDPMFGNAAKEMADQLEKGWKEAQDAVQKQEVIDQERNASYEKQKAQEVAGYINESANALLDAFTATGNVEALLQDSKSLKVYIDGESIKGVSSTIDDILNSVETRVNRALGSVGHLHEAERKAIENDLLLNEMAFKAKTRSQEDYYRIRKDLSTKALNLESTDLRDALDKQLSDGLLTQEQYWSQVEQLRSDGTTKLAQIDDDFKLPGIQAATEHFKELRDRVNQLSALNAPEVFPDIQKSIGVTLDEINNFAGKDLLTQDQQGQLSDFSKTLVDVSDNLANASDSTDQLASVVDGSVANIADALDELNTIVEQVTLGQIAPDDFLERMRLLKPILEGFDLSGLEIPQEVRAGLSEGLSTIKAFEGLYESSAPQAKVYGNAIKNLANDVKEFAAKSASGKMSVAEFNDTLAQLQNRISLIQQNPMNEGFFKIKTDDLSKQLGLVKFGQDAPETRKAVDELTASLEGINKAFSDGLIDQPKYIELLGHLKDAFDALATSNATTDAVKKISIDSSKQISATLNGLKHLDSGVGAMFAKVAETVGKGTDKASKVMSIGLNTIAKVISGSKSPIQDALNGVFDMIASAIETGSEAADGAINAFIGGLKGAFNAIMSGNYAGAVVSAVGGIIQGIVDWFSRTNRAYEELKKKIGEFKEQLKSSFVDADQYVKKFYFTDPLHKKAFGDYMVTGIDEVGAKLALSISDGVTSGFKNGMKAAINGDANWQDIIKNGMRDALIDGFIEAFIQKAVLQGILAAPLTALSKAFESGDQGAIDAAMAAFSGMLPKAMEAIDKIIPGFVDTLNKAFPGMGNAGPGSLDFEQKKLADLQAKFGKATSDEERKKLQAQIDAQQAIIDKIKAKTEKDKPQDAGPGSLDYENKILQDLMGKYNKETDAAKRLLLAGEIEKQKAKIKSLDPLNNPYKYGDIVKRNPDGTPDLTGGGTYITGNIKALPMLGVPDVPTGDTAIPFGTSVKNFGIHVDKFGEYMKYAEMIKDAAEAMGGSKLKAEQPNWTGISKR